MRTGLAFVLALALASPVSASEHASPASAATATATPPAPGGGAPPPPGADTSVDEPGGTDGEVRPGLADLLAFGIADVLTRTERFERRLVEAAEHIRYAETSIGEPYYHEVGEDSVRIAATLTGRDVGGRLDADAAEALVAEARDELAPTLALAGIDPSALTRDGLAAAASRLGIELGDGPIDAATLAQLRAVSDDRLVPALLALGRDPGQRVSRQDLVPVLTGLGEDPAALDGDALARVVAEAEFRLAPLAYATGMSHDELGTRPGLEQALGRVGAPFGTRIDADDLAAGLDASRRRLTLTPPRRLGGSLTFQRLYAPGADGPVSGYLLRWRTGPAGGVSLATGPAGSFNARAPVTAAAARAGDALAVVNGGYWALGGDPDGLLVSDGKLTSSRETLRSWVRGVRAGFGLDDTTGRAVVGPPEFDFGVELDGRRLELDGVDRPVGAGEAVLYTDRRYVRPLPDDVVTALVPAPDSLVRSSRTPFRVRPGGRRAEVPSGSLLLVARGGKAAALRAGAGRPATLQVDIGEAWEGVTQAMSGGPWLLRDGHVPEVEQWRTEGFGSGHTDRRHPRSAIAFDGAGNAAVLTIDGRQPGYSVGMTHQQTGRLLAALGMRDAVMLDGGGSSQMVVGGRLANRPCCDRNLRPVATALYLRPRS